MTCRHHHIIIVYTENGLRIEKCADCGRWWYVVPVWEN